MQNVKEDREKYIGGSDIPIIMGLSPFRTRWSLLREKALGELDDFDGNQYTEYGNILEPKIRDFVNQFAGRNYVEAKKIDGIKRYHADGYDEATNTVLEIKTTGEYTPKKRQIYLVQLLYGMQMYGAEKGMLAVYSRPEDFCEDFDPFRLTVEEIVLEDHRSLIERVNISFEQFVEDIGKLRENSNLSAADLLPAELTAMAYQIEEIEMQLIAYDEIKKQHEELKENLRQAMLKNGIKSWETPNNTKITLVLDGEDKEVWEFDKDRFAEENPIVYKHYLEKKIKKGRKGYVKVTYRNE